ncbi:Nn.00g084760.m01.CDS01 [Neocucurbitaria sp. VM-36]
MIVTTTVFLRYTVLLSSIVLIVLSLATFYLTGNAFKTMAMDFPGDEYPWFRLGVSNPRVVDHMVTLVYDWTTENLVFLTSSLCVVVGFLGLIGFVMSRGWKNEDHQKSPSTRTFMLDIVFAFGAFGTGLTSFIWASVNRLNLKNDTCRWEAGMYPNAVLTCSRELAACELVPLIVDRSEAERQQACSETHASRMMIIPLFVFSLVLTVAYAAQRYRDQRAAKWVAADERVGYMQREEY